MSNLEEARKLMRMPLCDCEGGLGLSSRSCVNFYSKNIHTVWDVAKMGEYAADIRCGLYTTYTQASAIKELLAKLDEADLPLGYLAKVRREYLGHNDGQDFNLELVESPDFFLIQNS